MKDLIGEEIIKCLRSLMFLNEKHDCIIKGYHCAYGRKQQYRPNKKDFISPTMSIDAIFIIAIIREFENHELVVTDNTGDFISYNMYKVVLINIQG